MKNKRIDIRSTTILGVRLKGRVAVAGDGQVTLGDMAMKQKAVKVRKFDSSKGGVVGGFAGAAADALTLFEKFEQKLDEYQGDLKLYEEQSMHDAAFFLKNKQATKCKSSGLKSKFIVEIRKMLN